MWLNVLYAFNSLRAASGRIPQRRKGSSNGADIAATWHNNSAVCRALNTGLLIPIGVPKEPNEDFRSFVDQASQKKLNTGRFLDESTFFLSHGAHTTPSSCLD